MADNITPATKVQKRQWMGFNLTQTPVTTDAGVTHNNYVNINFAVNEFLGDEQGVPQQIIRLNVNQSGRYLTPDEIKSPEYFGEILTREDGSHITLLDLISEKLQHATDMAPETTPAPTLPTTPSL